MVCGTTWPTYVDYKKITCPVLLIGAEKVCVIVEMTYRSGVVTKT